jgi:formyl-CoA transferase
MARKASRPGSKGARRASGGDRARRRPSRPPFTGLRVVDLTTVLSGPFCTYQLALMGAEVIKVEQPPAGDMSRTLGSDADLNQRRMGAMFLAQNAGKKSITLNLKVPGAAGVFRRLAATADVVVENFRPGVMDRLGLGAARLRKGHPALVYCAISGFGQDGPYRDNPAYDQIIQGLSGAMSTTGEPDSPPYRAGYPVGDTAGGMAAAFAIASALFQRERTGRGQVIDVALLDTMLVMLGWVASDALIAGVSPRRAGNDNTINSPSGAFRAADGFLNIAANSQAQYEALCRALGRPELIADPRFVDRPTRLANRAALREALERDLARRGALEWERLLSAAGVPAGRVRTVGEALGDSHVRERGLLRRFAGAQGVARAFDILTTGYRFAGTPWGGAEPPPALGQHTEALLKELGYGKGEIAALKTAGAI